MDACGDAPNRGSHGEMRRQSDAANSPRREQKGIDAAKRDEDVYGRVRESGAGRVGAEEHGLAPCACGERRLRNVKDTIARGCLLRLGLPRSRRRPRKAVLDTVHRLTSFPPIEGAHNSPRHAELEHVRDRRRREIADSRAASERSVATPTKARPIHRRRDRTSSTVCPTLPLFSFCVISTSHMAGHRECRAMEMLRGGGSEVASGGGVDTPAAALQSGVVVLGKGIGGEEGIRSRPCCLVRVG